MTTRFGLALTLAMGFGLTACAGGASSGGSTPSPAAGGSGLGGQMLQQGERPRQTSDTRNAQRALDQAEQSEDEAAAQGLYAQALESAKTAIQADSTNPLPHLQAGIASMGLGQYREADAFLDRAEELRPIYTLDTDGMRERAWIDLYNEAAPLLDDASRYAEAVEIFEQANAIYDGRPEIMIILGQIYAQLRRPDDAIRNLDMALALIGDSEAKEGMDPEIVAEWEKQAADIPFTKALVLHEAGRSEEAVAILEQIVAERPDDIAMRRNLAGILIQAGDLDRAFRVYEEIMGQPGLENQDYYLIGVGFYQGSEYGKAADAFGQAAALAVKDRDALEMWARSLQLDSAYAEVVPVAERWRELDPASQVALQMLAGAAYNQGQDELTAQYVELLEGMDVVVNDLQMQRRADGVWVTGSVVNKKHAPGTEIMMGFTFYDAQGNTVGTQALTVTLGQQDMSETFEVMYTTEQAVQGYGYTVMGG